MVSFFTWDNATYLICKTLGSVSCRSPHWFYHGAWWMLIQLKSFVLEFRFYGPLGFDGFCSKIILALYLGMQHFWKLGGLGQKKLGSETSCNNPRMFYLFFFCSCIHSSVLVYSLFCFLFSVCISYMLLNFELIGLRYLTETIVQVYFHAGMEQTSIVLMRIVHLYETFH
jgi:hypothetical protein